MAQSEEPDPELRDIDDLRRIEQSSVSGGRRKRAGYVFAIVILAVIALIVLAWILAR